MNADSAFQIGATHAVCQDYSLAWDRSRTAAETSAGSQVSAYVILSDGCSSSPDTDTGARLLAKAAAQTLLERGKQSILSPAEIHRESARRALAWAKLLGLPPESVDATLLIAQVEDDELIASCTGDGVLCFQSAAGALDVYSISYPSGYPLYPAYAHQPERLATLAVNGRSGKAVKHFHSDSIEEPLRLRETSNGDSPTEVFMLKEREYRYVALFSDGIHSFFSAAQTATSKRVEAVAFGEALRRLISFKSTRGAFVARRMKGFLKDCRARGWQHADDLAFGALHLGD